MPPIYFLAVTDYKIGSLKSPVFTGWNLTDLPAGLEVVRGRTVPGLTAFYGFGISDTIELRATPRREPICGFKGVVGSFVAGALTPRDIMGLAVSGLAIRVGFGKVEADAFLTKPFERVVRLTGVSFFSSC